MNNKYIMVLDNDENNLPKVFNEIQINSKDGNYDQLYCSLIVRILSGFNET